MADDGRVNPVDATMAFAKGAKMGGAQIFEGVSATGILTDEDNRNGEEKIKKKLNRWT